MPGIDANRHVVDFTLDLVMRLGARAHQRSPRIFLTQSEITWARSWVKMNNPDDRPVVGVHPGAHYPSQRWPIEHYATLSVALQRERRCQVVLIGGPADHEWIDRIRHASSETTAVYRAADLRKAAALMSQFHVMVCNNSGPLHLAAAFDVPTVSFMGPTNALRWCPVGPAHRVLRIHKSVFPEPGEPTRSMLFTKDRTLFNSNYDEKLSLKPRFPRVGKITGLVSSFSIYVARHKNTGEVKFSMLPA